jgi:hypothetical protein
VCLPLRVAMLVVGGCDPLSYGARSTLPRSLPGFVRAYAPPDFHTVSKASTPRAPGRLLYRYVLKRTLENCVKTKFALFYRPTPDRFLCKQGYEPLTST